MSENAPSHRPNAELDDLIADAQARFAKANPQSAARHNAAMASMPGGNTRAVLWYRPFPLTMVSGEGCTLTDMDGHTYADFVSEYSAGLFGHSNPDILAAMRSALNSGLHLGAPNTYEATYSQAIVDRFPAIERVRFCNSGTEANIMALSTARAVTGRPKIFCVSRGLSWRRADLCPWRVSAQPALPPGLLRL